jgi:hypothetical protein
MRLASLLLSLTVALSLPTHAGAAPSAPDIGKSVGTKRAAAASDTTSETTSDSVKEANAAPTVIRSEFGLFFPRSAGKKKFVATRTVPLVPNQAYGWMMTVEPQLGKMRWREEFVLPVAPSTWGGPMFGVKQEISADGKTSVRHGELQAGENMMANVWTVADGDPKGKYVIRMYLDDKLVETYNFNVE